MQYFSIFHDVFGIHYSIYERVNKAQSIHSKTEMKFQNISVKKRNGITKL